MAPLYSINAISGSELAFALKSQWEDSLAVCATDNEMKILLGQVRKYYLTAITTPDVVSRDCPAKPHQTRNFIVITICVKITNKFLFA